MVNSSKDSLPVMENFMNEQNKSQSIQNNVNSLKKSENLSSSTKKRQVSHNIFDEGLSK